MGVVSSASMSKRSLARGVWREEYSPPGESVSPIPTLPTLVLVLVLITGLVCMVWGYLKGWYACRQRALATEGLWPPGDPDAKKVVRVTLDPGEWPWSEAEVKNIPLTGDAPCGGNPNGDEGMER